MADIKADPISYQCQACGASATGSPHTDASDPKGGSFLRQCTWKPLPTPEVYRHKIHGVYKEATLCGRDVRGIMSMGQTDDFTLISCLTCARVLNRIRKSPTERRDQWEGPPGGA